MDLCCQFLLTDVILHLVCSDPLGLENMKIPNSAFTYSSSYSTTQGYYARLNDRGWYPTATDELATLKIGFQPEKRKITAIALQSGGGYVSTYELYYSPDGLSVEPWIDNAFAKVRLGTPLNKSSLFNR